MEGFVNGNEEGVVGDGLQFVKSGSCYSLLIHFGGDMSCDHSLHRENSWEQKLQWEEKFVEGHGC